MKKILVLGTGNAQTDFIKYCNEFGYTVHACSYKKEGRGIKEADYFELIDIKDAKAVENYAKTKNIDIIYSVGSDLAMPSVAAASENLGLKSFISEETAKTCNDKNLLRGKLGQLKDGKYSVNYRPLAEASDSDGWDYFPAILKPADSQGQRGITHVDSAEDIATAFETAKKHSPSDKAIIEEYVQGSEISVNSYIINGEPQFLFVTDRISFADYPGGIIKSHVFPSTSGIPEDKLWDLVKDTTKHLKINNGPVYYQIKADKQNNPKVIEVTPRLDGCHIWNLIYQLGGPNLFETILLHLTGNSFPNPEFSDIHRENIEHAELFFFTLPPETIMNKNKFKLYGKEIYLEWYYEDDETIRPLNNYSEKVGYTIRIQEK
jgi:biotin carboxylase